MFLRFSRIFFLISATCLFNKVLSQSLVISTPTAIWDNVTVGAPTNISWSGQYDSQNSLGIILQCGQDVNTTTLAKIAVGAPQPGYYLWTPAIQFANSICEISLISNDGEQDDPYTDSFTVHAAATPQTSTTGMQPVSARTTSITGSLATASNTLSTSASTSASSSPQITAPVTTTTPTSAPQKSNTLAIALSISLGIIMFLCIIIGAVLYHKRSLARILSAKPPRDSRGYIKAELDVGDGRAGGSEIRSSVMVLNKHRVELEGMKGVAEMQDAEVRVEKKRIGELENIVEH